MWRGASGKRRVRALDAPQVRIVCGTVLIQSRRASSKHYRFPGWVCSSCTSSREVSDDICCVPIRRELAAPRSLKHLHAGLVCGTVFYSSGVIQSQRAPSKHYRFPGWVCSSCSSSRDLSDDMPLPCSRHKLAEHCRAQCCGRVTLQREQFIPTNSLQTWVGGRWKMFS